MATVKETRDREAILLEEWFASIQFAGDKPLAEVEPDTDDPDDPAYIEPKGESGSSEENFTQTSEFAGVDAPGDDYKEWEHPRGRDGKWIEKFGVVKVFKFPDSTKNPRIGEVVSTDEDGIRVRMEDNNEVELHQADVIEESKSVARLDGDEDYLDPVEDDEENYDDILGDILGDDFPEDESNGVEIEDDKLKTPKLYQRFVIYQDDEQKYVEGTGHFLSELRDGKYEIRIEESTIYYPGMADFYSPKRVKPISDDEKISVLDALEAEPQDPPSPYRPDDFPTDLMQIRSIDLLKGVYPEGFTSDIRIENLGINSSRILTKEDGKKFFIKELGYNGARGASIEVDVANLLREMNLNAPFVERTGGDNLTIVSTIAGENLTDVDSYRNFFGGEETMDDLDLADPSSILRLGLVDLVLNNEDRHSQNVLYGKDENGKGVLLPIDNELAIDLTGTKGVTDADLAYDAPLRDFVLNKTTEELNKEVREELVKMRKTIEDMSWINLNNKKIALERLDYFRENQQELIDRMKTGGSK